MKIKIVGTNDIVVLSNIDPNSGVDWVLDSIKKVVDSGDGKITWSEKDGYEADADTVEWWQKFIADEIRAAAKEKVILEIARGDSMEELLDAKVIEERPVMAGNGEWWPGYVVIGGTAVEAVYSIDRENVEFAGMRKQTNAWGFSHGQRQIFRQADSGCYLVNEVFFG